MKKIFLCLLLVGGLVSRVSNAATLEDYIINGAIPAGTLITPAMMADPVIGPRLVAAGLTVGTTIVATISLAAATVPAVAVPIAATNTAIAVGNRHADCEARTLTYKATNVLNVRVQAPEDNEFLYLSKGDFEAARSESKKSRTSGSVRAFECDAVGSVSCRGGQVVDMPAGHVFKGRTINKARRYRCVAPIPAGDDRWEDIGAAPVVNDDNNNTDCDKAGYERAVETMVLTTICPECSRIEKGKCYNSDMLRCYEAIERGEPANWNGEKCNCGDKQKWDPKNNKCVAPAGQSCAEKYRGYPARIACCNAGRYTKWEGSIASGRCICVNPQTQVEDPTLEWVHDGVSATGMCRGKGGNGPDVDPVIPNKPEEKECWYSFHGEFKCGNGTRVRKDYQIKLTKEDLKGLTCESFQEKYRNDARGIESLFKKLCLDSQYTEPVPLDAATKKAISNINSFFDMSEANRNVWRDEDGQFNTARLASDATAGVVLGTVGGIVSAKIIKKKQLEKGFDVLHCTVGGQKMADYGDTFQVSYQR